MPLIVLVLRCLKNRYWCRTTRYGRVILEVRDGKVQTVRCRACIGQGMATMATQVLFVKQQALTVADKVFRTVPRTPILVHVHCISPNTLTE